MDGPVPVTVITGFLGAGKSTLLERWLGELPSDTAVIVNEQGAVGIDGELLAQRAKRVREITGGCICCVTYAALDAALAEFAEATPTPSRIVVETSGVASPAGVIRILTRGMARDELRLDGVVTVIDAARARSRMKFPLTIEQLGFADIVLMSHVDQCGDADLDALQGELAAYAPGAVVARADKGQLVDAPAATLLGLLEARAGVLRVPPDADDAVARHRVDAVSFVHDGEVDEERFAAWVEDALGAVEVRLLRIKGILAVRGVEARVIVQGVSEAVEVTLGPDWGNEARTSRLVVLGLELDETELRAGFAACAVAE
ncbi:MAG: GTP-binding protein [Myxococcota bacterium]